MVGIAGQLGGIAVNTEFVTAANEVFNRRAGGPWQQFALVQSISGRTLEIDAMGPSPAISALNGSRPYSSLRQYARAFPVKAYTTPALELGRDVVELDKSGNVAARLRDYLSAAANFWEKPVIDALLSNPIGIDGVSILNDTHPHAPAGGTWDNKVTTALSQSTLETGIVAMRGLRLENGEPAGIFPTHLVVGPANEREALDLTGADRAVSYDNAGAPDTAASVVAATTIRNWIGGRLTVVVVDRFADGTNDNSWMLMDLSKPGVRPLIVGEGIAPQGVVVDDPGSENMKERSSYAYYCEGYAAIGGYIPHCIYGRVG